MQSSQHVQLLGPALSSAFAPHVFEKQAGVGAGLKAFGNTWKLLGRNRALTNTIDKATRTRGFSLNPAKWFAPAAGSAKARLNQMATVGARSDLARNTAKLDALRASNPFASRAAGWTRNTLGTLGRGAGNIASYGAPVYLPFGMANAATWGARRVNKQHFDAMNEMTPGQALGLAAGKIFNPNYLKETFLPNVAAMSPEAYHDRFYKSRGKDTFADRIGSGLSHLAVKDYVNPTQGEYGGMPWKQRLGEAGSNLWSMISPTPEQDSWKARSGHGLRALMALDPMSGQSAMRAAMERSIGASNPDMQRAWAKAQDEAQHREDSMRMLGGEEVYDPEKQNGFLNAFQQLYGQYFPKTPADGAAAPAEDLAYE